MHVWGFWLYKMLVNIYKTCQGREFVQSCHCHHLKSCLGCHKRCYSTRRQWAMGSTQPAGMTSYPTGSHDQQQRRLLLLFVGMKSCSRWRWGSSSSAGHAPGVPEIKTLPSNGQRVSLSTRQSCGQHNFHTCKRTGLSPRVLGREEGKRKTKMLPKQPIQFSSLYHLLLTFFCCCLTLFYIIHSMWVGQCHCSLIVHRA